MTDAECVEFLQRVLPRLGLRWSGYRKVRGQVRKRLARRIHELELAGLPAYEAYLEGHLDEWERLDAMCRITISRFYRDRGLWDFLRDEGLPALARAALRRREETVHCWSAGCASGEEPYTLALVWRLAVQPSSPRPVLRVLATDGDEAMLERARAAIYPASSLKDLPQELRREGFEAQGDRFRLRDAFSEGIELRRHDVRRGPPATGLDLILCRNLVFTYFDDGSQSEMLTRFREALRPEGALIIGAHEHLPGDGAGFAPWRSFVGAYTPR